MSELTGSSRIGYLAYSRSVSSGDYSFITKAVSELLTGAYKEFKGKPTPRKFQITANHVLDASSMEFIIKMENKDE